MPWVAQARGAEAVTADLHTIAAAADIVFGRPGPDPRSPAPVEAGGLAAAVPRAAAEEAVRLLIIVALVDGSIPARTHALDL